MGPSDVPAQSSPSGVVRSGFGVTRSLAVPTIGLLFALGGGIIGWVLGSLLLGEGGIQRGSSNGMVPAVVGVLGGATAWLVSVLVCMWAFRRDGPPSREETISLVVFAVGFLFVGLILAEWMPSFEDPWKDPRMFRLQRLIWLDAGLAAATCLVVAQRRLTPLMRSVLMATIGLVSLAVALSQFLPFAAACPTAAIGACRAGF